MTTIYHLDSSGRDRASYSRKLTFELVQRLKNQHNNVEIIYRDLGKGLPFIDETMISGLYISDAERTAEQKQALKFSDQLVSEIQKSDILVLGIPIYNFSVPASFKAWADLVARAGLTFKFGSEGSEGLLKNKKAYVIITSGGTPVNSQADFATPWIRFFLGFIGINDVEVIAADKLLADDRKTMASARQQINQLAA